MYYSDKSAQLRRIFGEDIQLAETSLQVGDTIYPIIDDVIITLNTDQYPNYIKAKLSPQFRESKESTDYASDIQHTFGEEWKLYSDILPEHQKEFNEYFDVVDAECYEGKMICDLGCGIGRWAHFLQDSAKDLVLIDFSEAIFVARRNLTHSKNSIFIMADIQRLPMQPNFCDFMYCLGVLHHLPSPALKETRLLSKYAPNILVYLYYALDNRPFYFRFLLVVVSVIRRTVSRIRTKWLRSVLTEVLLWFFYIPLIAVGHILSFLHLGKFVPLYEGYKNKGLTRLRQDVYDRFFTRIEQRVTRKQITELADTYSKVVISDGLPYWHFLCQR